MAFREFFEDTDGGLSSMRLMSFFALLVAISMTATIMVKFMSVVSPDQAAAFSSAMTTIIYILMLWVVAAFVPKYLQKIVEIKGLSKFINPGDEKKEG